MTSTIMSNVDSNVGIGRSAVKRACLQLAEEVRRLAWQFLWVGSGLCLEAAICAERFIVDLAEALERKSLRPIGTGAWSPTSRLVCRMWRWLSGAVKRWAPRAKAWRRLARQIDAIFYSRLSSGAT